MYEAIDRYIEHLLSESTPEKPAWNMERSYYKREPKWNYVDGCMFIALAEIGRVRGRDDMLDAVEHYLDYYVFEDGTIRGHDSSAYILDDVCAARALFGAYERTKKEKYRLAIDKFDSELRRQPRTYEGAFWHKLIYPAQLWLDGIYMAQVFAAMLENYRGTKDYSDILNHIELVRARMFDPQKKLYYHGYDCSKTAFWADENGLSENFWLRAEGWFLAAITDLIELTDDKTVRKKLSSILSEALGGLIEYRDPSGLYWQVIDQAEREGNYLETSGSAMVAYAMLKGARVGAIDKKYAVEGKMTFDSICKNRLSERDGTLCLSGICLSAGLGPDNNTRRDGSFEYYISEPIVENDAKGVAPFMLTYAELLKATR